MGLSSSEAIDFTLGDKNMTGATMSSDCSDLNQAPKTDNGQGQHMGCLGNFI
jgi:hypothetical protein